MMTTEQLQEWLVDTEGGCDMPAEVAHEVVERLLAAEAAADHNARAYWADLEIRKRAEDEVVHLQAILDRRRLEAQP